MNYGRNKNNNHIPVDIAKIYDKCRDTNKGKNFARCDKCKERFLCWTECKPYIGIDYALMDRLAELGEILSSYQMTMKEFVEKIDGINKEDSEKV